MTTRIENDSPGSKELSDDVYYGVQTLRGKENFHITGLPMSMEPYFVKAFGYVKRAAPMANCDLGGTRRRDRRCDHQGMRSADRR